jgi:GTP-binding protein HflX
MYDTNPRSLALRRALLVGAYEKSADAEEARGLLDELGDLAETLGLPVADKVLIKVAAFQPRYLVGEGKMREVVAQARALGCDVVVVDNELHPSQQRNWEKDGGIAVIDRQEVILDIFARRARTREAQIQVQLARLEYTLPRLARMWGHLDRQGGGGGGGLAAKGEGERQIELDRRILSHRIDQLRRELKDIRRHRATLRKQRQAVPVPNAALVGYTNAGKSSLLRALTGADVYVADQLFATLDTTTRRVDLPNGHPLLLTDTVGFVRKLPHRLVESFKATLEEAVLADFLVHVIDASHAKAEEFRATTQEVLRELGADPSRMLEVFNKIDAVADPDRREALRRAHPEAVFVSTLTGEGLDTLRSRMADLLAGRMTQVDLALPLDRADLLAQVHAHGRVLEAEYGDAAVQIRASLPRRVLHRFAAYTR